MGMRLDRRRFLQCGSVCLALPWLESLATAAEAEDEQLAYTKIAAGTEPPLPIGPEAPPAAHSSVPSKSYSAR